MRRHAHSEQTPAQSRRSSRSYDCRMAVPDASASSQDRQSDLDVDVLVLGVRKTDAGPVLATDDPAFADLAIRWRRSASRAAWMRFGACPRRGLRLVPLLSSDLVPSIGVNELRYAAGSAARQLRGAASLGFALAGRMVASELLAVLEGAAIGAYGFTAIPYRGGRPRSARPPPSPWHQRRCRTPQRWSTGPRSSPRRCTPCATW